MNHAITITPEKTLVITVPEGTEVDRVMIRKMDTQESKMYWRDEVLDQYKWERDIAIQQLKELGYGFGQEPKTDGDTISRQAAIDVASRECHELRGIFSYIEQGLKELPSAQPRKGKWIEVSRYYEAITCKCSLCGQKMTTPVHTRMNFCAKCGADMRGERG